MGTVRAEYFFVIGAFLSSMGMIARLRQPAVDELGPNPVP